MSVGTLARQAPNPVQPTNSSHIWNLINDDAPNKTDYKYIVDFYLNPLETSGTTRFARLKISPNSYGVAQFDAREIVWSHIIPNITIDGNISVWNQGTQQYQSGSGSSSDKHIANSYQFKRYNQSGSSTYLPPYNHTAMYGLVFGEEYYDGNGNLILNIADEYSYNSYGVWDYLTYSLDTAVGPVYPGTPNRVNWTNANLYDGAYNYSVLSGASYLHTTSNGTFVDSGTTTSDSGNYVAVVEPSKNDIVYLTQNESGCGYYFIWNCDTCETSGWNYRGYWCNEGCGTSHPTLIWPGTKNILSNLYEDSVLPLNPLTSWMEYNLAYKLSPYKQLNTNANGYSPTQFLNVKGIEYGGYSTPDLAFSNQYSHYKHRRTHHRDCPIILNFFNIYMYPGYKVDGIVELTGQTKSQLNYGSVISNPYPNNNTSSSDYQDVDEKILSFTKIIGNDVRYSAATSVGYFLTSDTGHPDDWDSEGISEILKFDLYESDCLTGEPLHFVFLNSLGVWDTITFGQKNIRSYTNEKKFYKQNMLKDWAYFTIGNWELGNVPYDMETQVIYDAQSTFVDENDVPVYKDFFLSPYTFLISRKDETDKWFIYPITITSNSVEEYKQRYNKIYQYDLSFVYNTIEDFNNPL